MAGAHVGRASKLTVQTFNNQQFIAADRRRLAIVLLVTAIYCLAEVVGGFMANSLALLSDAVHMLTDIGVLSLAFITLRISTRPATPLKTYGYVRAEILGAVLNGVVLWLLVGFIWFEAVQRLRAPEAVHGSTVMAIAAAGIVVNLFSAWLTRDAPRERGGRGLAVRAAFVHAVCDLIGVGGVLVSGALVQFTGWRKADPAVSLLIGALVLYNSWGLLMEGVNILMESVPTHIDLEQLRGELLAVEGTEEVHDLHVWCLTTREFALSAHAVIAGEADHDRVLSDISELLERKFNIRHITVQLERDNRRELEPDHF